MKKKVIIFAIIAITLVSLLFTPVPQGSYDDGGTREYAALTYKVVKWNRLASIYNENGTIDRIERYNETSIYWFPDNFKSIDELWKIEQGND